MRDEGRGQGRGRGQDDDAEDDARPATRRRPGPGPGPGPGPRYDRLRRAGGARLADPAAAVQAALADPFADVRLAVFRALADPSRFLLVELLRRHGPLATTELEAALGLASGTVSHHLRVLETARLVVPERAAGWTFWRLVAYPLVEALVPRTP